MKNQELINRGRVSFSKPDRMDKLLKLPKLGKDDSFAFGCNQCGKCCREREDILLTPLDLFKIAKYLNKSIQDILEEYCEFYEGADSKVPIVRIKPKEYRKTCPFCEKGRCSIQPIKPVVCALFPLGRMTNFGSKEFSYFLQPVPCGNKNQTQTVREWLTEFSILNEEEFTILWHEKVGEISAILREVYGKIDFNHDGINAVLFLILYVRYDLEKEFIPQFTANCGEALRIAEKIRVEATSKEGVPDG
jgi:Fe-S-cluster containining protein